MIKRVDVVRVNSTAGWAPEMHHAVEEEGTERILFECDTQADAISWVVTRGYRINIHRERNRKPADQHGQFRAK